MPCAPFGVDDYSAHVPESGNNALNLNRYQVKRGGCAARLITSLRGLSFLQFFPAKLEPLDRYENSSSISERHQCKN
jgi:hypothetical protein